MGYSMSKQSEEEEEEAATRCATVCTTCGGSSYWQGLVVFNYSHNTYSLHLT